MVRFDAAGLTVKVHCGGEGAVRRALDAVGYARRVNGPDGPRHELAHCCLVDAADFGRFAPLRVGAEMSPAVWHLRRARREPPLRVRHCGRVGGRDDLRHRLERRRDAQSVPGAARRDPTRRPLDRTRPGLAAMTINGARAVGHDNQRGTLSPGNHADLIVLDRHLFDSHRRDRRHRRAQDGGRRRAGSMTPCDPVIAGQRVTATLSASARSRSTSPERFLSPRAVVQQYRSAASSMCRGTALSRKYSNQVVRSANLGTQDLTRRAQIGHLLDR